MVENIIIKYFDGAVIYLLLFNCCLFHPHAVTSVFFPKFTVNVSILSWVQLLLLIMRSIEFSHLKSTVVFVELVENIMLYYL